MNNSIRTTLGASLLAAFLLQLSCGTARPPLFHGNEAMTPSRTSPDAADTRPHPGMLRYPDVSATQIVFLYANDLWLVSRNGGVALPLSSPKGQETFPKFSTDGRTIAFVGNYDGNADLYTLPVDGGVPRRVTHHPSGEFLCDWTPSGDLLFYAYGIGGLPSQSQLFTVPATGGLPKRVPVPYGASGAISRDGKWLAYTPHTRDFDTWKRYRGGMATDIWLFGLESHASRRITKWEGTDSLPMWHGDDVYYLSDEGPEHRLNLWGFDTKSARRWRVTDFEEFDVKWPSIGPGPTGEGEIIFQNGSSLFLLDLGTGKGRPVTVSIPGDRPAVRPKSVDASKFIANWSVSPSGKRAVIEARGDVWTAPGKKGVPRNLTRTSGVAERDPSWSPDGQWIAYFSDASGEYELTLIASDGSGEQRKLTSNGKGSFRVDPTWSPDSKRIAFRDKAGRILVHTVESGETKTLDVDPLIGDDSSSWSFDGRYLAYAKGSERNRLFAIWIANVETGEKRAVTGEMFNSVTPAFDRKGDYLYFVSNRSFSPIYGELDTTFVYAGTQVLLAAPLRADMKSPWAPKSDEETWTKKDEKGDKDEKKSTDAEKKLEARIDFDGIERRTLLLPVKSGLFGSLAVNDKGALLFVRLPSRGSQGSAEIKLFDVQDDKKEEKSVATGAADFRLSADGKKLLVIRGASATIQDASAGASGENVVISGMAVTIDPRAEWRQMFWDAWRLNRDYFYDPHMHGVDWLSVGRHYSAMLEDCASREDLSFVLGELIAELNVGHAYVWGEGDDEKVAQVSVGMLGADFQLDRGAYRISKILEGAPWDSDARGPLSQPGVGVKEGDYLLRVNGIALDASQDPWAAFQRLAGQTVTLTVSAEPKLDSAAREVVVEPLPSEESLRYRSWVEKNRAGVERKSNGRIGYIYVPNTGIEGQTELVRQFYGQIGMPALIIDERWNGGGQVPTRFIELLNRPTTNYWARRDGADWQWPPDAHQGPKCMLINGLAGSGGDAFPAYFRQAGLGKLIGTRTWGGLVGISGNPGLIDGGAITVPTFAFYESDGTWGIEGHGVDPDIEVIDDPALMVDGGDPQLDAAIAHLLEELERHPYRPPARPPYPDRSGMGLTDADR